ncbi:MAG: hypothetical protein IPM06_20980 [Rhizobiales bacterium]|nr:hypothetical protein [Hyphomicrobiales bacterium]
MSVQITTAFVQQFKSNVKLLTQQKGSKLRPCVETESVTGNIAYFEQIGATAARKRTSRHADTPRMDTPHARRRVSLFDYEVSDLIDNEDKIRMLIDPTSQYTETMAMALGRSMDDEIIAAADGTAYTGVDGSTATAYDTSMTVAVTTRAPGVTSANYGLNVAKILAAGERLGTNNVDQDDEKYLIINSRQVTSLLNDTRISSADFNLARPLMSGQVAEFGGFKIVVCNRIVTDSNDYDKCLFWAKGGMKLGLGQDIMTRVSERDDKGYSTQIFAKMTIGATRMEEVRVGYIECHTTNGPSS